MAKKTKPTAPKRMTKKESSRAAKEARTNRQIIIGASILGVLVVSILAYGYIAEVVVKAREPVATVNGVAITTADMEAYVRYYRLRLTRELAYYEGVRSLTNPNDSVLLEQLDSEIRDLKMQLQEEFAFYLGSQVMNEMVESEIVRQEAERLEITVSQGEVDQAIEQYFGYDAQQASMLPVTETESATSTVMTREQFEEAFDAYAQNVLDPSGLGEDGFRAVIETSLLYEQVRAVMEESVPTAMDQVQLRYIAFPTIEEATLMMGRLDAGESWEELAAEIEGEEESAVYVGVENWQTESLILQLFGTDLGLLILQAEIGETIRPLEGSDQRFYIVQILDHQVRDLDELMLSYEKNRVFEEWLSEQKLMVEYVEGWQDKIPTSTP